MQSKRCRAPAHAAVLSCVEVLSWQTRAVSTHYSGFSPEQFTAVCGCQRLQHTWHDSLSTCDPSGAIRLSTKMYRLGSSADHRAGPELPSSIILQEPCRPSNLCSRGSSMHSSRPGSLCSPSRGTCHATRIHISAGQSAQS